jgi:hypothetical protein
MTTETERAKQLARNHWGYIEATLATHGVQQEELTIIGHHYTTAMIHGFGHGVEAERKGAFRPRIGAPLPLEDVERVSGAMAKTPPLCVSCALNGNECEHSGETVKWCGHYTSSLRERIAEAKEPQALDLSLPSIMLECTAAEAYAKYLEECAEVDKAGTVLHSLIELWDCIQAVQTSIEKGGAWQGLYAGLMADMLDRERRGNQVLLARRAMLMKNAARWRYSDSVNRIIIESNGERWK